MAVVILPRSALIEMNDKIIKVELPEDNLEELERKISAIESTYGIWKKKKIDPIEYQKRIRKEWDKRLWKSS
ncbi:MAG: hypothetical protein KJ666_16460 [Bacteroidetes bacterium]|nr:hypothetical protein [Bacteroidota bacterium]